MMMKNLAAGIALAALALGAGAAQAAATKGACTGLKKMAYAVANTNAGTSKTTFTDIPEAFVVFTQVKPGCVVVRYAAESIATNAAVWVRPVLDASLLGHTPGLPKQVQLSDHDNVGGSGIRAHSYEFVFPNVEPGPHLIKMQWSVSTSTGNAKAYQRSTIILHR